MKSLNLFCVIFLLIPFLSYCMDEMSSDDDIIVVAIDPEQDVRARARAESAGHAERLHYIATGINNPWVQRKAQRVLDEEDAQEARLKSIIPPIFRTRKMREHERLHRELTDEIVRIRPHVIEHLRNYDNDQLVINPETNHTMTQLVEAITLREKNKDRYTLENSSFLQKILIVALPTLPTTVGLLVNYLKGNCDNTADNGTPVSGPSLNATI